MSKLLLMFLVLLTDVYAVEKTIIYTSVQEVIESNTSLKNRYEKTNKFLRLYKNSLNKIDRTILLKKEMLWKKEEEACLKANPTECLNSHYLKIANSLKDEYIKSHGLITLSAVSEKLSKNYNEVMVKEKYEVEYNNKEQENSVCLGKENQRLTKGTVLLIRFYNKVLGLFEGKKINDKNYREYDYTDKYVDKPFVANVLKNFSTKILEKQIVFGLKMLNKEDKLAVAKSLKKLDEMYIYYLNHTNVTEEEIFRLNERKNVCNYVNEHNKEDFNYGHRVDVSYLGKNHVTLQLHSVVDYMYTFWHRRDMEGNLEKSRELLDFALDFLEAKEKGVENENCLDEMEKNRIKNRFNEFYGDTVNFIQCKGDKTPLEEYVCKDDELLLMFKVLTQNEIYAFENATKTELDHKTYAKENGIAKINILNNDDWSIENYRQSGKINKKHLCYDLKIGTNESSGDRIYTKEDIINFFTFLIFSF